MPSADAHTSAPRRLMVIFNPTAGGAKGRRLRQTLAALQDLGCLLTLRETSRRGDAEAFAALADPNTIDAVVVAGGDGTVNEALNGLMQRPVDQRVALGIIPLGTANVLALEIAQDLSPTAIAHTLAFGPAHPLHLAQVCSLDSNSRPRFVLLMAGTGFDAHVVENVRLGLKRKTGKLAYVFETLWQALHYPFPRIHGNSQHGPFDAATVVVCNGRLYGGPFVAAPDGSLAAPSLRTIVLQNGGLWHVLRYTVALAMGRLSRLKDVTYSAESELTLQAPVGAPLQADGDIIARLPVRISGTEDRIWLLHPCPISMDRNPE